MMECDRARILMLDARRGSLPAAESRAVKEHIASCPECRAEDAADEALSQALARVSMPAAPPSLVRALQQKAAAQRPARSERRRSVLVLALFAAAVAALIFLVPRNTQNTQNASAPTKDDRLLTEAVNDHLRVLYAQNPVEIENGGIHQVKPWFAGKLDFAPVDAFGGDADYPLTGGSVAYFVDRKAAAYVYKRNLHIVTLFVFRADGLSWPTPERDIGHARGNYSEQRGFHAFLWKSGDLGYALVSDLNEAELFTLATKIAQ